MQGILPFIHFLTRSNETVFGHVPEWCVLASAALCLTIHPSLFRAFFPPHLCASGSAGAQFISEPSPRGQETQRSAGPGCPQRRLRDSRRKTARVARARLYVHTGFRTPASAHLSAVSTLMREESSKRTSKTQMAFDAWVLKLGSAFSTSGSDSRLLQLCRLRY